MGLEILINDDIKQAMRAKDTQKLAALRAIKAALLLEKTGKDVSSGEIPEAVELKLLQKLVKQRRESAAIYKEQNRAELAKEEEYQASIIEAYLPKQLSEEELKASIDRFTGLGLRVQFTEVDIRIQKPVTADKLEKQAEECKRIIKVALEHPACDAVLFWGVDDGHSWINSWDKSYGAPLLFDSWYDRKPAYYEVRDYLLVEIERRQGGEEGEEDGEKE